MKDNSNTDKLYAIVMSALSEELKRKESAILAAKLTTDDILSIFQDILAREKVIFLRFTHKTKKQKKQKKQKNKKTKNKQ